MIEYLEKPFELFIDNKRICRQKTLSGYGKKLPTQYKVMIGNRIYFVWAICWSNVASHYIIKQGKQLFLSDSDFDNIKEYKA